MATKEINMAINYATVIEIKRLVQDKFGIALHFHDSCGGGTYFSIEQKSDEITAFLQEYFASRHIHLSVSENGLNYTAE